MTEAQKCLAEADLRSQCAEAVRTCGPVALIRIAQALGLHQQYAASEDAGKPWEAANG